jgi:hypothetical protein
MRGGGYVYSGTVEDSPLNWEFYAGFYAVYHQAWVSREPCQVSLSAWLEQEGETRRNFRLVWVVFEKTCGVVFSTDGPTPIHPVFREEIQGGRHPSFASVLVEVSVVQFVRNGGMPAWAFAVAWVLVCAWVLAFVYRSF